MDSRILDSILDSILTSILLSILKPILDLYIKLLSEASFSIECSLDEYKGQRIERERLEHRVE